MILNNVISGFQFRGATAFQKSIIGLFAALPAMAAVPAHAEGADATPVAVAAMDSPATGGVFEKAGKDDADPQFRSLFLSWKKMDQVGSAGKGFVSIPSRKPVSALTFTSSFGVRSDPFKGGRAMHAGVDIPGPIGTPIYATADGIVGRAQRAGGYGNLVEIEHGQGIQTRYGHLSSIVAAPGARVKRGDLIGLMGSTGRSTGSHLHYEVRLDGRAVNPMPFLQSSDYVIAMQQRTGTTQLAMGGPGSD